MPTHPTLSELYLKSGAAVTNFAAHVTVRRAAQDNCASGREGTGFPRIALAARQGVVVAEDLDNRA